MLCRTERLSRCIADRGPARTAPKSWNLKDYSRSRVTRQQEGQIRGPTMMPRTCGQVAASSASRPVADAACLKDGYYTTLFLAFGLLLGWLFCILPRLLRLPCAFSVFLRCTSIDWISDIWFPRISSVPQLSRYWCPVRLCLGSDLRLLIEFL
jgi:hypothetical protein